MGQVVNTDAQFIAQRLAPLGFQVFYHTTVGDNVKRLTAVVHQAVERSDVVVFTERSADRRRPHQGDGRRRAGPHRRADSRGSGALAQHFETRGYAFTPNNLKQASFPKSAIILPNAFGTAPGCIMTAGEMKADSPPAWPYSDVQTTPLYYIRETSCDACVNSTGKGDGHHHGTAGHHRNQTNPFVVYIKTGGHLHGHGRCARTKRKVNSSRVP